MVYSVSERSYVLGVDSSTGATKAEIVDIDTGELVAHSRAPHPPTTPPISEQDPELWWRALVSCLESVVEHLPAFERWESRGNNTGSWRSISLTYRYGLQNSGTTRPQLRRARTSSLQ